MKLRLAKKNFVLLSNQPFKHVCMNNNSINIYMNNNNSIKNA